MVKLEDKDPLLTQVWHNIELISHEPLHTRSQLFMTILMGKCYRALVAQTLPYCYFADVFSLSLF
jgi:hypothetical protein